MLYKQNGLYALALLTLVACETSGGTTGAQPTASAAPVAVGNQTPVGPISYGGSYTVAPGGTVVIHGARQGCSTAPAFESVGVRTAPVQGTLYDAGISQRNSDSCGSAVPTRAIGYRASPTFSGMDKIMFNGGAEVTITSQ